MSAREFCSRCKISIDVSDMIHFLHLHFSLSIDHFFFSILIMKDTDPLKSDVEVAHPQLFINNKKKQSSYLAFALFPVNLELHKCKAIYT